MRPERCRSSAVRWVTPRGVSLSGVRAASWRFAPYCSHGTRSLKLRPGRAALLWETVADGARHTCCFARRRRMQYSDFYGDILPVSWRLPRSGAPD